MQSRADATAAGGGSDLHPERPPLAKDTASLGRALEKCRPYLLSVANDEIASDLTSKAGASDIVQDTMLEASRDIDQFDGQSEHELKGWLRRILRNNLANFVRSFKTSDKRRINLEVSLDRDGPNGRAEIDLAGSTLSPSGEAARCRGYRSVTGWCCPCDTRKVSSGRRSASGSGGLARWRGRSGRAPSNGSATSSETLPTSFRTGAHRAEPRNRLNGVNVAVHSPSGSYSSGVRLSTIGNSAFLAYRSK
jgi:hypothetical protein